MADVIRKIRLRRGIKSDLPVLDVGEPGLVTDESELYIGTATGNVKLTSKVELTEISSQLADIVTLVPKSNGIDDTLIIQNAIENAKTTSGIVKFAQNQVYILTKQGTTGYFNGSANIQQTGYCLKIPSNITLDLNGSTLKLANNQNADIIINEKSSINNYADQNISIKNGILDGNKVNQGTAEGTFSNVLRLISIDGLYIDNLKIINGRGVASSIQMCKNGYIGKFNVENTDGFSVIFGLNYTGATYDMMVYNFDIECLTSKNAAYFYTSDTNKEYVGNSFVIVGENIRVGTIKDIYTQGGKIQTFSKNVFVENYYSEGDNSVLKVQGESTDGIYKPKNITINNVIAKFHTSQVVYLNEVENVSINSIKISNSTSSTHFVFVNGINVFINDLQIIDCTIGYPLSVKDNSKNIKINNLTVINAEKAILLSAGSETTFGNIYFSKKTGVASFYALEVNANCKVKIDSLKIIPNGDSIWRTINIRSKYVSINQIIIDGMETLDHTLITLANGTTTTTIANAVTVASYGTDISFRPVIKLVPYSVSAKTLGIPIYCATSDGELKLYHNSAVGTEKYIASVVKYIGLDGYLATLG